MGNDYSFAEVFWRRCMRWVSAGDVLVAFSTSGNSPNILAALEQRKEIGHEERWLSSGCAGGNAAEIADCSLIVRHDDTARAQEGHQFLIHALMDEMERLAVALGDSSVTAASARRYGESGNSRDDRARLFGEGAGHAPRARDAVSDLDNVQDLRERHLS